MAIHEAMPDTSLTSLEFDAFYHTSDEDARAFLVNHPELADLLLQIRPALRTYFGPQATVTLRTLHTPDDGSTGPLLALIAIPGSIVETQALLDRFDEEFWLDHPAQASSPLIIGLE